MSGKIRDKWGQVTAADGIADAQSFDMVPGGAPALHLASGEHIVGRTSNERRILHVLYGHVRAAEWLSNELSRYWAALLESDFVDPQCC